MNRPFLNLDLMMLSQDENAVVLQNEFMMNDNLDMECSEEETTTFEFQNYPIKLSFIITIFCLSGSMRLRLNLQEFEIRENDIFVALPGSIGEFYNITPGTRIACMAYTGSYFQITNHVSESMLLQNLLRTHPLCHLKEEEMQESMVIYRLMKAKIQESENPFRKEILNGYAQVLTYNAYNSLLLSEQKQEKNTKGQTRQQALFNRFMEEVRKHYTKKRNISFYADILCVTPKYLSKVVHTLSGRYASDWINDFVILEAKALIKSQKYTIQQVGDMLSFPNSSFFGKYFKDAVGCSPTTYQKTI